MFILKKQTSVLAILVAGLGAQAFASESELHCVGLHAIDAVIQSETSLTSVTVSESDVSHQSATGKKYAHFDTKKAFGSHVDSDNDGKVPSGSVIAFNLGDEVSWGYGLVLPAGFQQKKKFSASLGDWEPADNDGVDYSDLDCTVVFAE